MRFEGSPPRIAIVGAGFSGTLVAAHLLRQAGAPLTVTLIEGSPRRFGRGVAYAPTDDCPLLNVPAGKMSALPDDPEHFLRWARAREKAWRNPPWVDEVTAQSFLPRRAYGDYLRWVLDTSERTAVPGVRLERRDGEAVGLIPGAGETLLKLAGGETLSAQKVVLALGNFRPGDPWVAAPSFYQSGRYYDDPWAPEGLAGLLQTDACLLIGSGLTMVDWAITLSRAGYPGTLHVVSRRGLWPTAHRPYPPVPFAIDPSTAPPSVRAWLRLIRAHIRASGCDWRSAIDALRPATQSLWQRLPLSEKRRFLRHLRPFWDAHRHRMAPVAADYLRSLVESGRVVRHVGRIVGYREADGKVEVTLRRRGGDQVSSLAVGAVVNCCGSESDYRKLDSPLVKDLLGRGLIRPDPLSLGLEVSSDGALIGAGGIPSRTLFTLGPPQKGILLETNAVPEIRGQASRLAAVLIETVNREQSIAPNPSRNPQRPPS
jgi:uncharacterized NAD(P)/FAD-binding protein YdhS